MRLGAILLAAVLTILTTAAASAASPPNPNASLSAAETLDWDLVRQRVNEDGFYPVPEFLRARSARLPAGSPRLKAQRSAAGVAYPAARQMLIEQGFLPVKITSRGVDPADEPAGEEASSKCGRGLYRCQAYPELLSCSEAGVRYCAFLYENRRTRKYWIVSTVGEEDALSSIDFKRWRCCGYRPATAAYLHDQVIVRADGRTVRFPPAAKP